MKIALIVLLAFIVGCASAQFEVQNVRGPAAITAAEGAEFLITPAGNVDGLFAFKVQIRNLKNQTAEVKLEDFRLGDQGPVHPSEKLSEFQAIEEKAKFDLDSHRTGRVLASINNTFASITHSDSFKDQADIERDMKAANEKEKHLEDKIKMAQEKEAYWQTKPLNTLSLKPGEKAEGYVYFEPLKHEGTVNLIVRWIGKTLAIPYQIVKKDSMNAKSP